MAVVEPAHETETQMAEGRSTIAFFGHDCTESTVIKRARAFAAAGHDVVGLTFRREKFNRAYRPEWRNVDLGTTIDRNYGRRLLRLLQALPHLVRARRDLARADLLYARNLDMAALALVARLLVGRRKRRGRPKVVYEVLDVQRVFLRSDAVGFAFRFLERRVLAASDLLVVSSPAFMSQYFAPVQGYAAPWFLLENKIHDASGTIAALRTEAGPGPISPPAGPWVIAWLGNLRCPKSPELLREVATRLGERVRIHIHGYPTETGLESFLAQFEGLANVHYFGEYRSPDDLPRIYGDAHFAWAFDYLDAGTNSTWLLPNRLYEGGLFGAPALTLEGTETGHRVVGLGMGFTLREPVPEQVATLLDTLNPEDYAALRSRILALPPSTFIDQDDTAAMCRLALAGQGAPQCDVPARMGLLHPV